MSKIKVGDRVRVSNPILYTHNKTGTVEYISTPCGNVAEVRIDNEYRARIYTRDLKPMEEIKPVTFGMKVGDRVTVCNGRRLEGHNGLQFQGQSGVIRREPSLAWKYFDVVLDNGDLYAFYPDELRLADRRDCPINAYIESLSTSPQPQQTKPQEDTMRYAVLFYDLAAGSQPQIQANKATEAEAKLLAEQMIAQRRANIQIKQYFTIAIVDMQTGKLVGSVTDTPPAVEWAQ